MSDPHESDHRVLLLLRHGESTANADDVFGGWLDFPLTARGRQQAADAGRLIRECGLDPASVYTSLLTRAIDTADIVVAATNSDRPRIDRSWRLNERHYGQLQGRNRATVREEFGGVATMNSRRQPSAPTIPRIRATMPATRRYPRVSCRRPNPWPMCADAWCRTGRM